MIPPDQLITADFTLRTYRAGDGARFADAVNSSLEHLNPFLGWANRAVTLPEAEEKVRRFAAGYLKGEDFLLGIYSPDGAELWGNTGFHLWECPISWRNAEIGMWIRASKAGQGLGSDVLRALIAWGFSEWEWTRLAWKNDVQNIASSRAAEKAGMTLEGIHRNYLPNANGDGKSDAMCYAIIKSDWERTR